MEEEILRFSNVHTCIDEAAEFICNKAQTCIKAKGCFTMALSGGATPKTLYEVLAKEPYIHRIPWERTHFFWSDERFVSFDHPDSNYAMASRAMISHVPIPETNIHPVPVNSESAIDAATKYETHLRDFFSGKTTSPSFDLILLGLGNDGHAASLYPGSSALSQKDKWVDAVPKPGIAPFHPRITMTLPFINNAGCVLFLVTGPKKRDIVERIVGRFAGDEKIYPAAMIKPQDSLVWFIAT